MLFRVSKQMDNWAQCTVGDLARLKSGFAFKSSQWQENGIPVVKIGNVKQGSLDLSGCSYVSPDDARASGFELSAGDILIGLTGYVGQVAKVRDEGQLVLNQRVGKFFPKKGCNPQFLFFLVGNDEFRRRVEGIAHGSAQPNVSPLSIERLEVLVPPLGEQNTIAGILAALDDKIELNRRMNESLEGMAQAIFRDWFVDFGPTRRKSAGEADPLAIMGGLTPDPARAAELAALFPAAFGNEGLPVGWGEEPLLDQAHWINGAAYKNMHFVPKGMGLPVVKIAELKAGVSDQTKFTNTDLGQKYRINDGELLFSWSGNPDTSIDAFIWTGGEAWLNQHIFAVRENSKMDLPTLHTMLKWLMPQFAELARNKQTTGLGHVTKDDMKRLLVAKPSKPIAGAFSTFVGPIFERIVATLYENRTLAETRDYLLPRLMSGAVRVAPKVEPA